MTQSILAERHPFIPESSAVRLRIHKKRNILKKVHENSVSAIWLRMYLENNSGIDVRHCACRLAQPEII